MVFSVCWHDNSLRHPGKHLRKEESGRLDLKLLTWDTAQPEEEAPDRGKAGKTAMIQVSSGTANVLWKYLHGHISGGFEWRHYTEGCLGQRPRTHISMGLTDGRIMVERYILFTEAQRFIRWWSEDIFESKHSTISLWLLCRQKSSPLRFCRMFPRNGSPFPITCLLAQK